MAYCLFDLVVVYVCVCVCGVGADVSACGYLLITAII